MGHFVIICAMRTGSTLLVDALSQHPQIFACGERFNPSEMTPETTVDKQLESVYGTEGHRGFKLLYYQAEQSLPIYDWLLMKPDLQVIHLVRDNWLEWHVSNRVVQVTKQYYLAKNDAGQPLPTFSIPPTEMLVRWTWYRHNIEFVRRVFSSKAYLEVKYEDLTSRFDDTMADIFRFLGVAPKAVEAGYRKIVDCSVSELVLNYEELKCKFRKTKYRTFFD